MSNSKHPVMNNRKQPTPRWSEDDLADATSFRAALRDKLLSHRFIRRHSRRFYPLYLETVFDHLTTTDLKSPMGHLGKRNFVPSYAVEVDYDRMVNDANFRILDQAGLVTMVCYQSPEIDGYVEWASKYTAQPRCDTYLS